VAMIKRTEISPKEREAEIKTMADVVVKSFKGRDYDAEARGKTRCQLFGQAVAGLGYSAGMTFDWSKPDAIKNFAAKCIELADIGVKYSFQDTDEK
jgi:hypothetical protein